MSETLNGLIADHHNNFDFFGDDYYDPNDGDREKKRLHLLKSLRKAFSKVCLFLFFVLLLFCVFIIVFHFNTFVQKKFDYEDYEDEYEGFVMDDEYDDDDDEYGDDEYDDYNYNNNYNNHNNNNDDDNDDDDDDDDYSDDEENDDDSPGGGHESANAKFQRLMLDMLKDKYKKQ